MVKTPVTAGVLCLCAASALADGGIPDVAGIHLGMNRSDVEAAAQTAGFTLAAVSPAPSFDQAVEALRSKATIPPQELTGVRQLLFEKPGAALEIRFAALPDSAAVSGVTFRYFGPDDATAFAGTVRERYGTPDTTSGDVEIWGDAGIGWLQTGPSLRFDPSPPAGFGTPAKGVLTLEDPAMTTRSRDAILAASTGN